MKKICSLIICLCIVTFCASACTVKREAPLINSQRRLEKYIKPLENKDSSVVDLSEGPKLRYDADFGPKNPNFDFKIVNPY